MVFRLWIYKIKILGNIIEPPSAEGIDSAIIRLQDVGAFDANHSLTALGEHLSALPVDVRIGKLMLFGAIFQVVFPTCLRRDKIINNSTF